MTVHKIVQAAMISTALLISFSCAQVPDNPLPSYLNDTRFKTAVALEAKNRFYDAQLQWRILNLIYSGNNEVEKQVERIELKISKRTAALHSKLKLNNSDNENKLLLLKILALNPRDVNALAELRKIEKKYPVDHSQRLNKAPIKRNQLNVIKNKKKADKLESYLEKVDLLLKNEDHSAVILLSEAYLKTYPENEQALSFQFNALVNLADAQLLNGNKEKAIEVFEQALSLNGINSKLDEQRLLTLKVEVSNQYYNQGIKRFKTELSAAIDMFKKSLLYNPENINAKQRLKIAQKISRNLEKIKANTQ